MSRPIMWLLAASWTKASIYAVEKLFHTNQNGLAMIDKYFRQNMGGTKETMYATCYEGWGF